MSKSNTTKSNKRMSHHERAAIVAAAGIAAALGLASPGNAAESTFSPNAMAPHTVTPSQIHVTARGVSIHSDRLAMALRKNKQGTIKALQAQFPGITASQVSLGSNNMVTLRVSEAAFNSAVRPGMNTADNGICNGGACAAPFLPGEEGFVE